MPAQVEWLNDRQWRLALQEALSDWDSGLRKNLSDLGDLAKREAAVRCPVRTGRLRAGIETEIEDDEDSCSLLLFDDVEYSPFVEFGTRRMRARPFLRPGLQAAEVAYSRDIAKGLK